MELLKLFKRTPKQSPIEENHCNQTPPPYVEPVNYIDLGLTSGTLWADRNAGATGIISLGTICDKASAPGKLPTYEQCEELINECEFSTCLVPDENNIMKNFIRAEGPNKNSILFPCVRSNAPSNEIGFYCWCEGSENKKFSHYLMLQAHLLGFLDFAELTNVTIGMIQSETKLWARNVK